MDMLRRDKIVVWLCLVALYLTSVTSCNKESKGQGETELDQNTIQNVVYSRIGKNEYWRIWNMAGDSIKNWKQNNLRGWAGDTTKGEGKQDSVFCINSQLNKIIMARLARELTSEGKLDAIVFFYGVKIKEEWYFFGGPTAYIPRDEDSLNSPTSFTKLHEIAMQEVFSGYLKKKDLGFWRNVFGKTEYEVNEAWFASHFEGPGWDRNCRNVECYEKLYLAKVRNNWAHRDTTNYKHLK